MKKVFIDGSHGTTGLRIRERLAERKDIELVSLSDEKLKYKQARHEMLNSCDIAFLCLPDDAAIEAADMVENEDVVLIDTSTAHRTSPGWAYGFAELSAGFEEKIANSKKIAVPGCHASGFIALVYPLVEAGLLDKSALLTCFSLTGYSGGGKKMIAEYENEEIPYLLKTPRQYGISQNHKHLKEMTGITGLENPPVFCPIVDDFYSGMEVTVPVFSEMLKHGSAETIKKIYDEKYTGPVVCYNENLANDGFLAAGLLSGRDSMQVFVSGNSERILLTAVYDNLGKGASGAAIECMNIVTGQSKEYGLDL